MKDKLVREGRRRVNIYPKLSGLDSLVLAARKVRPPRVAIAQELWAKNQL
jgi:hypothetical protein